MAGHRGGAISELMHVLFADEHGPGALEARDHLGVFRRNAIGEDGAGARGLDARRVEQIFQPDGDSVQRAAPRAGVSLGLERPRLPQGLVRHNGDEGIQLGIQALDAIETRARQFHRRNLLRTDLLGRFEQGPLRGRGGKTRNRRRQQGQRFPAIEPGELHGAILSRPNPGKLRARMRHPGRRFQPSEYNLVVDHNGSPAYLPLLSMTNSTVSKPLGGILKNCDLGLNTSVGVTVTSYSCTCG